MKAKDLLKMKSAPVTIRTGQSLEEAMRMMVDNRIGSLIIVDDDNNPVNLITERDIFGLAWRYRGDMMDIKVDGARKESLVLGKLDDDVDEIARAMMKNHIRHVPIMDEKNHLRGIITMRDVVEVQLGAVPE